MSIYFGITEEEIQEAARKGREKQKAKYPTSELEKFECDKCGKEVQQLIMSDNPDVPDIIKACGCGKYVRSKLTMLPDTIEVKREKVGGVFI